MRYGDAKEPELLDALRGAGFKDKLAGLVRDEIQEAALRHAGVHHIINPFHDAAEHTAAALAQAIETLEESRS